jgi:hypothetical protein
VHSVDQDLKQQQAFRGNTNSAADYNAIVGRGCEVTIKRNASSFVRSDQAKIGLPPTLRHLPHADRDPGMNLFSVKPWRQRGVREIDSLWLLADKQHPLHIVCSISIDSSDPTYVHPRASQVWAAKQRGCVAPENHFSTACPGLEASGRPLAEVTNVSIRASHLLLRSTAPGRLALHARPIGVNKTVAGFLNSGHSY